MICIAIHGTGRMAEAITRAVKGRNDVSLIALAGPQAPDWGSAPPWFRQLDDIPQRPDLLIDFTLPEGTLAAARWCAENAVPLLSGVTGLPAGVITALQETAARLPVLWSPNLSIGVNLVADLAARAAGVLDTDVPVVIEDIHHQWKKDAPSGTALMLGQRIAAARAEEDSAINYESIREGEVIGEHTVTFSMNGEEFSLVHKAYDRSIYALGAVDAGIWLTSQVPGLYNAGDWLSGRTRIGIES